ncbi:transcriptional regulator, LuxR family (plasmid) [Rhodococcus opacus]|uniref:Transcriptional regulator, LuxR family n=1 Tax=Rhodococcus opacus TaxID=37919 RepID=A0A1B1KGY8_RHOOP|nr:protein kinase [Rhodococcus opacus]ANS31867.1 transcriptional regulator, LuxR family [Rhodococcus opacus]
MADIDPIETQRDVVGTSVTAELVAVGFEDADEIGRGGFGVVFRCKQTVLDRTVAVKVLTEDLDDEDRERFFREQRAMGQLSGHPNIVDILQVGTTSSDRPFIVMPYHARGSLDARIRLRGPLPPEQSLRLGVKLAGAVETAHRHGILHRDVKPANILLTEYEEAELTDFGIAHIADGFETATGTITGSPAFTAPEVLAGAPPSAASDVYGIGATLFCAMTGHAAFERRSGEQVMAQFVRITTEPLPNLRAQGIAADIGAVVERAMSGNPADRPPTAAALGDELRNVQRRLGFAVDEMALQRTPGAERPESIPHSRGRGLGTGPIGTKGHLPLELTSFVGRRRELTEAKNLLTASRLLTLTGIGGVGKTRLGLRVAAGAQREFGDGVRLIELGELTDESLMVDVVAAALGMRIQSTRRTDDVLVEFLAPRELLLVLDNCEHVVDAAAQLSEMLLRFCPRLRILATSREALGIGGEAVLRVPPLTVPGPDSEPSLQGLPRYDAVTLFADRASAAVPTFGLTDDNRTAVARICQRLDGLPLPIELAAARMRAMSPAQILQKLSDRYALLTRGSRDAPSRQQTLRLCIDWSHDLCTPQEQLVWSRLSVFAGSAELDAAEQVCGDGFPPEELLDLLTSLVDKSILIREEAHGAVQFRLLETLRDYGREQAQRSGEYPVLLRRHRDWYLRLALDAEADWISPRQLEWIARLGREQPNLRETLEYCVSESPDVGLRIVTALYLFWSTRGLYSEGRRWLDRFLAGQTGQSAAADHAKLLYAASMLAELQGDLQAGEALVREGRTLAEGTSDSETESLIDHADGLLAFFGGDLTRARPLLERSLAAFRRQGDTALQVEALWAMGLLHASSGEPDRAISCYQQALTITESRGESVHRAYALCAMAILIWQKGDVGQATALLDQGLVLLARLVEDPVGSAMCLEALAWVAGGENQAHRAAALMGAAKALGAAVGSSPTFVPNLRAFHDQCEHQTRQRLGEKAYRRAVREGADLALGDAVAYALGEHPSDTASPTGLDAQLTTREKQVAELIAEGLTNRAIATRLTISPRTAQGHVEHILVKLGFTSRAQVAAWVVERKGP